MLLLFSGWSSQSQLHNKHSARIFGEIKPSVWIIILSGTRMCLQRRLFKMLWSISSSYHLPHGQEIGNCELVNCIITNPDKWNFRNYFNSRTKVATFTYQEFIVTVYVPEIHSKKYFSPDPSQFHTFQVFVVAEVWTAQRVSFMATESLFLLRFYPQSNQWPREWRQRGHIFSVGVSRWEGKWERYGVIHFCFKHLSRFLLSGMHRT